MNSQPTLFEKPQTLDDKFWEFHKKNPQVYSMLEDMALDLYAHGKSKIGIGMLFEVMRWKTMLQTTDSDYKLNNSYRSRYARLLADNHSQLKNFFEIRKLHS